MKQRVLFICTHNSAGSEDEQLVIYRRVRDEIQAHIEHELLREES